MLLQLKELTIVEQIQQKELKLTSKASQKVMLYTKNSSLSPQLFLILVNQNNAKKSPILSHKFLFSINF